MTAGNNGEKQPDIRLIECGSIGSALVAGYYGHAPHGSVLVVDRNLARVRATLPCGPGIQLIATIADAGLVQPAMTLPAVKPQAIAGVLPLVAAMPSSQGLVVSVAVWISAATIGAALPNAWIVRAMPNTPVMVGEGATGLWCCPAANPHDRQLCETLFARVGLARWVADEAGIDVAAAVSGSGPAYAFAFVEALTQAGRNAGLPPSLADELARATLTVAAAMLKGTPAALKAAVRSPGGTTEAALRVFEDQDALPMLIGQAWTSYPWSSAR